MKLEELRETKSQGMSKAKLLLGAAGLLLFIVGVRKTFRTDAEETFGVPEEKPAREGAEGGGS